MTSHPDYWNRIYFDEARPGWDMDRPTPVVTELLELAAPRGLQPGAAVAVPGCGFGHDAAELARLGFAVTGLDFAPLAIAGARERYGDAVDWQQADWFITPLGPWDAIFDHTCFPAMDPERRADYVAACAEHLKPGGLWLAVAFHDVQGRSGPPHATPLDEMRRLAGACFEVLHLEHTARSHPRRAGREYVLVARKRA